MRAERRHELKENDLAHVLEVAREYLSEHGARIGFVVVAVLAVIAVISIAVRSRAVALEDAWQRKNSLAFDKPEDGRQSLETLGAMIEEAGDPSFVLSALIDQGGHALRLAQEVDDPPDPELNETAGRAFQQLLTQFGENPLAFGAAHCGLATVAENRFALDYDSRHEEEARQHLQAVIDYPALHGMPFHRLAVERDAALDKVFRVVRFEPKPLEEELGEEPAPTKLEPVRISEDQVPKRILQKVRPREDGTLEVLETHEE